MLDSILGTQLTLSVFLACTAASLLLGVGVALVSTFRSRSTPGFAVTLALLTAVNFGQRSESERVLKITIPESLDYDGLFDDLFDQYTRSHTLERVKTANMGTM